MCIEYTENPCLCTEYLSKGPIDLIEMRNKVCVCLPICIISIQSVGLNLQCIHFNVRYIRI